MENIRNKSEKIVPLSTRVPEALKTKMKIVSAAKKMTMAEFVTTAIDLFLKAQEVADLNKAELAKGRG